MSLRQEPAEDGDPEAGEGCLLCGVGCGAFWCLSPGGLIVSCFRFADRDRWSAWRMMWREQLQPSRSGIHCRSGRKDTFSTPPCPGWSCCSVASVLLKARYRQSWAGARAQRPVCPRFCFIYLLSGGREGSGYAEDGKSAWVFFFIPEASALSSSTDSEEEGTQVEKSLLF